MPKEKKNKILVAVFFYNEGEKIFKTVKRHPRNRKYNLLLMDDGSTDGAVSNIAKDGLIVLHNPRHRGIGYAMKKVFNFALNKKYQILVIQAGNNKDDPTEIPKLIDPILQGKAEFVQGSRFLPGGSYQNTPLYRVFANRFIHPLLFSLAVGKKVTDSTNGFRAFKTEILKDKFINWKQSWLDHYELEPYLLYKIISLGYAFCEVPVSKNYPQRGISYTKMIPFIDWWNILKPVLCLWLRIKK